MTNNQVESARISASSASEVARINAASAEHKDSLDTHSAQVIAQINAVSSERIHEMQMWEGIASAWAWPLAAALLVCLFRLQLRNLFDNVSDFEGFGVKAKFRRGVERLAAQVAASAVPMQQNLQSFATRTTSFAEEQKLKANPRGPYIGDADFNLRKYIDMVSTSLRPDVAILDGWSLIEAAINELADLLEVRSGPTFAKIQELRGRGAIDAKTYEQINDARKLRNLAAHGRQDQIPRAEVALYTDAARIIAGRLNDQIRDLTERRKKGN